MVRQIMECEAYISGIKYMIQKGPPYNLSNSDFEELRNGPQFTDVVEDLLKDACHALQNLPDVRSHLEGASDLPIDMLVHYVSLELQKAGFKSNPTDN